MAEVTTHSDHSDKFQKTWFFSFNKQYKHSLIFTIQIFSHDHVIIQLYLPIHMKSLHKQNIKFPRIASKTKSFPGDILKKVILDDVSAKSWLYYSPVTQYGYKNNLRREIASLTKIMTSICTVELCKAYKLNMSTTYFKVTPWSASMNGTTAHLAVNAWISIEDLLYGLMLPSGNDAAMVLAENLGAILYFDKIGDQSMIEEVRSIDLTEDRQSIKYYIQEFVDSMNEKALKLKMHKTHFGNPHGLDHVANYSCCDDVLIMSKEAMKVQKIRKVVATQTHKGTFKFFKNGKVICRPVLWSNTNKLLGVRGVCGVKTGITSKAGGCLSTCFKTHEKEECYIIVLGSVSTEYRFKDTELIMDWAEEEDY